MLNKFDPAPFVSPKKDKVLNASGDPQSMLKPLLASVKLYRADPPSCMEAYALP